MKCFVLIFYAILEVCVCANILALFPLQASSHYAMYKKLLIALAERGHKVDVLSHFPSKTKITGFTDLSVLGSMPLYVNNISMSYFENMSLTDSILDVAVTAGVEVCETIFKTDVAKELNNTKKTYDLVITEIFGSDCMLGFAQKFNAPSISLISSVSLPWANDRIGNPDNPSYIPNYFTPFQSTMNLFERVLNTLALIYTKLLYDLYSVKDTNRLMKQFFGPNITDVQELTKNTSLILVNSYFSSNQARPVVPNFIEVGGLHIDTPNPMQKKYRNNTDQYGGIIYMSMGSMVLTETFPKGKLQGLLDAFAEMPCYVLWKADKSKFPEGLSYPLNVYFEPWMPQLDILCDPKVQLFISHGGLMGIQEAIYCGVPILGIPLFADQRLNLYTTELLGVSQLVPYKYINKYSILTAAKKLLLNRKFQRNVKKLSRLFKDRPAKPLETAVYWVEYVIRHRGAPHLRSVGADLSWYQYYLLDVIIFIFIFGLLSLYILKYFVKRMFKSLCKRCKLKPKED